MGEFESLCECKMKDNRFPAVIGVLLAIVSVQTGASIAKVMFPVLGAVATSALRIVISAIILVIFNRPNLRNLTGIQWKWVSLYGLVLGAMNIIFYLAITRIPLGLGVTLEFIGPLTLALLSSRRFADFLWVLLAAAGIAFITPWSNNGLDLIGMLLALLAGAFWAAYILLGQRVTRVLEPRKAVTIGMIFASILALPIAVGTGLFVRIQATMLLPGIALALLSSAIPFTLELHALRKMPPKIFSILMSLEPAVGALCGLLFLHEYLTLSEWLAVTFIIVASAGATLTGKIEKPAPIEN